VKNNKLDPNSKLLFIHIPKTAGISLRKVLERFYEKEEIDLIYEEKIKEFKNLPEMERSNKKVYFGHYPYGLHNYIPRPCSYITILREPIERVISLYSYVYKDPTHPFYGKFDFNKIPISHFVESGMTLETDNEQTRFISGIDPEFGQCSSEMLETAKDNLRKKFLVVGLSEYFDETVLLIKLALGWRIPLKLSIKKYLFSTSSPYYENTNVSKHRIHREDLSDYDLNIIRKYNEFDIQLYNYAEKLFFEQIKNHGPSFKSKLKRLKEWR